MSSAFSVTVAESGATPVIAAAALGLVLSFAIEALMLPRPRQVWSRPWGSNAVHVGLWLVGDALLVLLLGRPWSAMAVMSALLLVLVLVNNAKVHSLREPFVFQDYEYFTDAIRHPRLYIPFLGWMNGFFAALGLVAAISVGLWLEEVPEDRFDLAGQLGAVLWLLVLALILLVLQNRSRPQISFEAEGDLLTFGFLACLWWYARAERDRPSLASPFDFLPQPGERSKRPHLVVIQSESFCDPRPLYPDIREDILAELDQLKTSAVMHGKLTVPTWGANTVRTEFAFLSGIPQATLGVHRFNPYRKAARWGVGTLASYLKRAGYRTVCIHPYPASFYARDRVYPGLGFDELVDIAAFRDAERSGPYVGDVAVAEKIAAILDRSSEPLFVFAITMENHGPLHLEHVSEEEAAELYTLLPPGGCEDLSVYLRHLRNADRMAAELRRALDACPQPAWLCWFGDHVPIMAEVYKRLGNPDARTEYLVWRSGPHPVKCHAQPMEAHRLAFALTRAMWGTDLDVAASVAAGQEAEKTVAGVELATCADVDDRGVEEAREPCPDRT